jgi:hypothetical protein
MVLSSMLKGGWEIESFFCYKNLRILIQYKFKWRLRKISVPVYLSDSVLPEGYFWELLRNNKITQCRKVGKPQPASQNSKGWIGPTLHDVISGKSY